MSLARQCYHQECEGAVNRQINLHLTSAYVYTSMAYYFDRDDVALPNFYNYFKKFASNQRNTAEGFMTYQNKRGGRIVLSDIAKPVMNDDLSAVSIVTAALAMEKSGSEELLKVEQIAEKHDDADLDEYIDDLLIDKMKLIKEISDHLTNLNRVGPGLGEYIFDKESLG